MFSLQIWNNEDVSVGGWLGPTKANRVHSIRFDTEAKSRGCHNSYIITHKQVFPILKENNKKDKKHGILIKSKQPSLSY